MVCSRFSERGFCLFDLVDNVVGGLDPFASSVVLVGHSLRHPGDKLSVRFGQHFFPDFWQQLSDVALSLALTQDLQSIVFCFAGLHR